MPRSARVHPPAILLGLALAALSATALSAEGAPPAVARTLPNGLEVFVAENRAVPLVTICVAFRGGAGASGPDTAGLFHLYEHMLFRGNERYPNQASWIAARNALGVTSWNGATGGEYINYHVTVPSDRLADGLDFWAAAIRTPRLDAAELAAEKAVVLNEIRADYADPDYIARWALDARLFPTYPWRRDTIGPARNIEGATRETLLAMRDRYYVPRNAAILIGGDVEPEEAVAAVERFFGDWEGGPAPVIAEPPQPGIPSGLRLVYKDADFYQGVSAAEILWRGPDVGRRTADTYVADTLLFLLSSPVGRFKKAIYEKVPGLYSQDYIDFSYPTARDGGLLYFSTYLKLRSPAEEGSLLDRAESLRAAVLGEFALVAKDPEAYFGAAELAKAKRKLIDANLLAMEDPASFVTGTLTFWWAVASTDYFFGYEDNCSRVGFDDIAAFLRNYLLGAPDAVSLRVHPEDARKDKAWEERAKSLGYEEITPENAFWWTR